MDVGKNNKQNTGKQIITYPAVIKDSFSTQGYSSLVLVTKCLQERENLEANGTFQQANITKP